MRGRKPDSSRVPRASDNRGMGGFSVDALCVALDSELKAGTFLRLLVIAAVVLRGVLQRMPMDWAVQKKSYLCQLFFAEGFRWVQHDGLGMTIYFSTSFCLDMAGTFGIGDGVGYCETDKLVALYSMALLTFLPNAIYSSCLQEIYFDSAKKTWQPFVFIFGAVLLSILFFGIRAYIVFRMGWLQDVSLWMHARGTFEQVAAGILLPPVVDLVQSYILIAISPSKETGFPATLSSEHLLA